MSIFISGEKVSDTKFRVVFTHYDAEELEKANPEAIKQGFVIESMPEPEYREGFYGVAHYNTETNVVFFEYEPIPKTPLELLQDESERLKAENALLTEQTLTALDAVASVFEQLLDVQTQLAELKAGGESA
ncbi:hypothetical protein M3231_15075 [Neobacillus mesonae]|nr:hypothetical protein [Neobacillus mesonae]